MANEKSKAQVDSKFAEVIRKSKEKRAVLNDQSERRAQIKEESQQREDADRVDQVFTDIKDSEI